MATITQLEASLYRCDAQDLPDDFIGAAVLVDKDLNVPHAGILIRHKGETFLFHYTGEKVKYQTIQAAMQYNRIYFLKSVNFIAPILIASFINRCRKIEQNAKPEYGYFYDPSSTYTIDGEFKSPNDFPEFMTCVGFCINVFRYFTDKELFSNEDWQEDTLAEAPPDELKSFFETAKLLVPALKFEDFRKEIRRIVPIEYLAGAYSSKIPVKKTFTDRTSSQLKKILQKRQSKAA